MPKPIHVLNGPNLNLLGVREPDVYGRDTLADIERRCAHVAQTHGRAIVFRQTQREGELIEWLHEARTDAGAVVINAAAYGHTSIALHDAIRAVAIPVVDCHLSNTAAREPFRHHSHVTAAAAGVVAGFGALSYDLAVQAACALADARDPA